MTYAIQKDVPADAARRKAVRGRKYPFAQLAVNDMFFVPDRPENNLMTHASHMGRKLGRKFSTRHVFMRLRRDTWEHCNEGDEDAVLGIAVTRIE